MTDPESRSFRIDPELESLRKAADVVGGIMLGVIVTVVVCSNVEQHPPIKAVVTTAPQGETVPLPIGTIQIGPPRALMAGAKPDGNAGVIRLDDKGRVIAKCDLEP